MYRKGATLGSSSVALRKTVHFLCVGARRRFKSVTCNTSHNFPSIFPYRMLLSRNCRSNACLLLPLSPSVQCRLSIALYSYKTGKIDKTDISFREAFIQYYVVIYGSKCVALITTCPRHHRISLCYQCFVFSKLYNCS